MTIRELMDGGDEIVLVESDISYGLRLIRQPDGRISLADHGCCDSGYDESDQTCDQVLADVTTWLRCEEWEDGYDDALAGARQTLRL